jgi:A/G-specific adenine glycosylase
MAVLAQTLLDWYDRERRDLPWRRRPTAYRTLVSEFMLQQTVVATAVPYFNRFVARFPGVRALAAAREEEVLTAWSGLGYYRRARNLHRTAQAVVATMGGVIPRTEAALRTLPGVGEYTAAAVAAIAHGVRTFALDGNAARVLARLYAVSDPVDAPAVRRALRTRGLRLVPENRPGDFVQAVMELGARVCVAGAPRCGACPIRNQCRAFARGTATALPVRRPRTPRRRLTLVCVEIERRGRLLLSRRPHGTLLGGTWTLPFTPGRTRSNILEEARRVLGGLELATTGPVRHMRTIAHVFTHYDVIATVVRMQTRGTPRGHANGHDSDSDTIRWVSPRQMPDLPLSSFARKTLGLALTLHGTSRIPAPSTT